MIRRARASVSAIALALAIVPANAAPAEGLTWAPASASPAPVALDALTDRQSALLARCGVGEAGLMRVAARVVQRKLAGEAYLDASGLAFAQRVEGEPHVWPRAWVISGRAIDHETALKAIDAWRASFRDLGQRRCGIASGFAPDGSEVIAAVALDALADLEPLSTRARVGQWIEVDARMLVPTASARVVVLGPDGEPRRVPTAIENGRVRARFAADRAGAFTVQLVAEVATGPRPVLEARVFTDTAPPSSMPSFAAPGEEAGAGALDAAGQLAAMVDALRDAEGLPTPVRETALDAVATAHARKMMQARAVGHDVGDGEPPQRLQNAGIPAREAGENVAHAASVRLAHRALWQSPSHRANLLRGDFTRAGYGAAVDTDGSVWVTEVFAR